MLLDIKGVCRLVREVSRSFCDGPGKGIHIFVSTDRADDLRECALAVAATADAPRPMDTYVVQGNTRGAQGWPFSRVRAGSRVRLRTDGSTVSENSLIFPQTRPIVLLIESFGYLDPFDQRAYSHLVDGEGGEFSLSVGSVLICGVDGGDEEDLEAGSLDSANFYIQLTRTDSQVEGQ